MAVTGWKEGAKILDVREMDFDAETRRRGDQRREDMRKVKI
jgi:uncharacterized NAD-dependent epimerase/dehydratase family protein